MLALLLLVASVPAQQIPLKNVWALDMPETRDVRDLDQDTTAAIRKYLFVRTSKRDKAGPCFLVKGDGKEALKSAARILLTDEEPADVLPANEQLSLFFYSYAAPGYVVLDSIQQTEDTVTVRYKVVIHASTGATVHFALIPLRLPAGTTKVIVSEVKPDKPYQFAETTDRAVCDSCDFTVKGEPQ